MSEILQISRASRHKNTQKSYLNFNHNKTLKINIGVPLFTNMAMATVNHLTKSEETTYFVDKFFQSFGKQLFWRFILPSTIVSLFINEDLQHRSRIPNMKMVKNSSLVLLHCTFTMY